MGTNFYIHVPNIQRPSQEMTLPTDRLVTVVYSPTLRTADGESIDLHIGKRSAAGFYCWDCRLTLCLGGEQAVHYGGHIGLGKGLTFTVPRDEWAEKCPKCGQGPPTKTDLSDQGHPAGLELGFAKAATDRPTGVRGCSSFRWAMDPEVVHEMCIKHPDVEVVRDEYNHLYTGRDFWQMLEAQCPIRFTDSIGGSFS